MEKHERFKSQNPLYHMDYPISTAGRRSGNSKGKELNYQKKKISLVAPYVDEIKRLITKQLNIFLLLKYCNNLIAFKIFEILRN